jgi:hypothetical protein
MRFTNGFKAASSPDETAKRSMIRGPVMRLRPLGPGSKLGFGRERGVLDDADSDRTAKL